MTEAPPEPAVLAWARGLSAWTKVLIGVVTLVTTVAGAIWLFFPNSKPQPTPTEGNATFQGRPDLERLTRAQYLDRFGFSKSPFTAGQLKQPGALTTYKIAIKGYRGKALPVREMLVNDRSGALLGVDNRRVSFTPDRQDQSFVWQWWTPLPKRLEPKLRVILEIYPPGADPTTKDVAPLDRATTSDFAG
jgi:hypothetical protein